MIANFLLLLRVAVRNLFTSWINLLIGVLIFFGTVLVIVGGGLLGSLNQSMSRSVIGSVAGHIQVYSSASKEELSLYGGMGGETDVAPIERFDALKKVVASVPGVKQVVPMGINAALITSGNTVDLTLEQLRDLYRKRQGAGEPQPRKAGEPDLARQIESKKQHLQQMIKVLLADMEKARVLADEKSTENQAQLAALQRASDEVFWQRFDSDPLSALEFLENEIAPLVSDADLLYVRYVGTDLDSFQKSFDRMEIVDGQAVPSGQRGFLFSKFFYEDELKLKNARRLDLMKEAMAESGRSIATDDGLKRMVKENLSQTREIVLQLDPIGTAQAVERLKSGLGATETELEPLLKKLFDTNDQNFQQHYDLFYRQLAPLLQLYRVRVGDLFTIKAFTRTGYVQSVNVKVYGTFQFKGLEKSPLAGGASLMDLMSFRDLYGFLSADKAAEMKRIKDSSGAKDVARESAEAELFGSGAQVVAEATPGLIDEKAELSGVGRKLRAEDLVKRVYDRAELEEGVVLNAAVILEDSSPKSIERTIADINRAAAEAKLPLKAVSWQKASGLLGEFVTVLKLILYGVAFVIFLIAMVVINNAMMMATLQRTQTIGTLRAIGAQRTFVLGMVLVETLLLGFGFGSLGAGVGTAIMKTLEKNGIPAFNEYAYFFFSGPRLHPHLPIEVLIVALVVVILVSALSTLTPAVLATRVSPLKAMQSEE